MSSRSDRELLLDMLEAISRAQIYTDRVAYQDFIADIKTQDAVIRALEILGEASKGVSLSIKSSFPDMPWKNMAGLRDKLIHDYFGVNLDIVWEVATDKMSELSMQVKQILDQLDIE